VVSSQVIAHVPVLAEAAVAMLVTDADGLYVDLTVGAGGHSLLILNRLSSSGRLIGCDRDSEALAAARAALGARAELKQCCFSDLSEVLASAKVGPASGVLMDLGVSSLQLDGTERGFSYRFPGPLDLRMDQSHGETGADLLARLSEDELTDLIRTLGEDRQARRIARAIERERRRHPITTTDALASVIAKSVPATRIKSLSRVFQALRMAVNRELEELTAGLTAAWTFLRPGGRLVVLSYHSLEDRLVKTFMRAESSAVFGPDGECPPRGRLLLRKPLRPDAEEIASNPRARSARLRAIEKVTPSA